MPRSLPALASRALLTRVRRLTCPSLVRRSLARHGAAALAILVGAPAVHAQPTRTITGSVVEAVGGTPVPAAQVSVVGSTLGTVTRETGAFTLRVPDREVVLQVRRIGYRPVQRTVGATQATVTIELQRDAARLSEVVVTGVGTGIERRNLAQAVASVNAEELVRAPAASFEQMLAGKVAGADVQTNSGAPGGGAQVRLRGVSTINGATTPLYVIDGVIASDATIPSGISNLTRSSADRAVGSRQDNASNRIADLNPNDIETIEVLKGAAASAIYGSRANNGVILITTKRGRAGAPQFALTQRVGRFEQARRFGTRRFTSVEDAVATFGTRARDLWQSDVFFDHEGTLAGETPLGYETIGNVRGGTETTRYYASALLKHDGGIVRNTYYDKRSFLVNLDQSAGERVQFRLSGNALYTENGRGVTNNDNAGVSLFAAVARSPSFVDLRQRPDGSWPTNPFGNSNPLQTAALVRNTERVYRYIGSGSVTYTPVQRATQEVRLLLNGGVDFFNQRTDVFSPPELQFEPLDGLAGTSILNNGQNLNFNANLNAVHVWRPGGGRALSATTSVGSQYERRGLSVAQIVSQGLIGGLQNVSRATAIGVNQDVSLTRDVGLFAQHELLVRERLLLTAGFRADRSSNNSDAERLFFFPKAAASYRFSGLPLRVDELKVRAAYGESGNQPLYGQKFTEFLAANITGIPTFNVAGQWAANDVRPERQREIEGGVDVTVLGGRGSVELTGYQKTIDDLLLTRTPALSSGYAVQIFNGGSIRTRGAEAALRAVPVQWRALEWSSTTTFSMERSRALELPIPPFRPPSFGTQAGAFQVEAGRSLGQIIGNDSLPDGRLVVRAVRDAIPNFRMGFANTLRWRALSAFAMLDWQDGGITSNRQRFFYDLNGASIDCNVRAPDPNPQNESVCRRRNRLYAKQTAIYLEDASFVKLREVSLTWEVPRALVQRAAGRVESVRTSVSGRNLVWWTGYTGFDPEASNFGTQAISRGIDSPGFPPSRSLWFSVDVGF